MGTGKVSSRMAAIGLIGVLCFAWQHLAVGQGFTGRVPLPTGELNLGARHSPVPEAGVKVCDYWDQDFRTHADGTWEVHHVRGTFVKKAPNRQAAVVQKPENYDANPGTLKKLNNEIYFAWVKFRDNSDGSTLQFRILGEVPLGGVVMIGEWLVTSGRRALITCAVYQPVMKRVLLWFTFPESQEYGSAVLQETPQGLSGYYAFPGRSNAWRLTSFRE